MMRRAFLIIFLLLFCQSLWGQCYSLNDILTLTLLKNSKLNSFHDDFRIADAKVLQAHLRPNPLLDIESENLGSGQNQADYSANEEVQTTFLLSQVIELGGKRQARTQLARAERDRVTLDYEVKKRELFIETTQLFVDVLVAQQKIVFLEEKLKAIEQFSSMVNKRVHAGKASINEETNFKILTSTTSIDIQNALYELKHAKYLLAAQWGEPNNICFDIIGNIDTTAAIVQLQTMGEFLQNHPQIQRLEAENQVRIEKIGVEKSEAFPDANIRGGPRYLENVRKWVWVVGVTIGLPIHHHNQGGIRESYASLDKLEKEREVVWTQLLTELNQSYSALEVLEFELQLLKNTVLPSAQNALKISYEGYQSARYNYLEVLEAERTYSSVKLRYLQTLGNYHKALASLEGLTGTKKIFIDQCEIK